MRLNSLQESKAWAFEFAKEFKRPCVVLLDGDLGAGKTQVVRFFLEALKVKNVASPTFAIHHEYRSPDGAIDHVDLYRVKSDDDLEATGFWDLFTKSDGLVFVEWANRLPSDVWPQSWRRIQIDLKKVEGQEMARDLTVAISQP